MWWQRLEKLDRALNIGSCWLSNKNFLVVHKPCGAHGKMEDGKTEILER
jgi:hypothetical protein